VSLCFLNTCKAKLSQHRLFVFIHNCAKFDDEDSTIKPLKGKIEKIQAHPRESQQMKESQITKTKRAINSLKPHHRCQKQIYQCCHSLDVASAIAKLSQT